MNGIGQLLSFRNTTDKEKTFKSEDSLTSYLREIARIQLVNRYEEVELSHKIADLGQLEKARKELGEKLSREPRDAEWAEAVEMSLSSFRFRLHRGRLARDKLITSNLRLVVHIAKSYQGQGMDLQDLIQEGNLCLIKAAEKFDPQYGGRFSTYAGRWISTHILRSLHAKVRFISLSHHIYETIARIHKVTKDLTQEFGRKPTEEEIAVRMEWSIEKLRFMKSLPQPILSLDVRINRAEKLEGLFLGDAIEFDNSTPEETEGSPFIDFVKCPGETPEEWVDRNLMLEGLDQLLQTLNPRERDVVKLRWGLDTGSMKPHWEIGRIFDITRERVRQHETKALRKINRQGSHNLKHFLSIF
ncbi:MAG: sigma-70 family RNA polymerase sigma factor [Leptolyngbyaceae cyanobacterium bins.302]|nr:sigma-70 family RNA polymerase sigma factor [Leptolyngbyaceae cyanobacterium bins.302]